MSGAQTQGLAFPLRSGESGALQGETLTVGQRQIPLRDIVSARLVADTTAPVPPGMPPTPGVSLQLSDGGVIAFTPVEQLDCWRLLQTLAAARPELAAPLPPPPGAYGPATGYMGAPGAGGYTPPPGYTPGPGYNYGAGYGMPYPTESEKTLAGICHLSFFFAPLILPLIIWLAMGKTQPYASQQAKQAFWFHLVFVGLSVIAFIVLEVYLWTNLLSTMNSGAPPDPATFNMNFIPVMLVCYLVMGLAGLVNLIFSIIGAVFAFQGKPFHYPLLGWLQK